MKILKSVRNRIRPFQGGIVLIWRTKIRYIEFGSYQSRWLNTISTLARSNVQGLHLFFISTEDLPYTRDRLLGLRVFSYSGTPESNRSVPCHAFNGWSEAGIQDYEGLVENLKNEVCQNKSLIGWRGAATNKVRAELVSEGGDFGDFKVIDWSKSDKDGKPYHYLSMIEQARHWKYQLDLPGVGYSGRLKFWLAAEKIVFLKPHKYNEWWFRHLIPWTHYIPIDDLHDIRREIKSLEDDLGRANQMKLALAEFSSKYLTLAAQEERWREVLSK